MSTEDSFNHFMHVKKIISGEVPSDLGPASLRAIKQLFKTCDRLFLENLDLKRQIDDLMRKQLGEEQV